MLNNVNNINNVHIFQALTIEIRPVFVVNNFHELIIGVIIQINFCKILLYSDAECSCHLLSTIDVFYL